MRYNVSVPIYQSINFWISVGLFVYFTGNFFFLLFLENPQKLTQEFKAELIIIYSSVTIIKNVINGFAFMASNEIPEKDELNIPSEMNLDGFRPNNNLN